jgi:hypothetical protein
LRHEALPFHDNFLSFVNSYDIKKEATSYEAASNSDLIDRVYCNTLYGVPIVVEENSDGLSSQSDLCVFALIYPLNTPGL